MARARPAPVHPAERCLRDGVSLEGATALVTGASSGIGRETALALGHLGATVLVHGRDEERAGEVVDRLRSTDGGGVGPYLADFTDMDAVHDLADRVADDLDGGVAGELVDGVADDTDDADDGDDDDNGDSDLDVLVNNAGATFGAGRLTDLGIERTFQVNHLAPFVLTNRLLPRLRESDGPQGKGAGRVVVVASEAHRGGDLDLDAVTDVDRHDGLEAYRRSKLANVMFAAALARREADRRPGVPANACHPGFVPDSLLWRGSSLPVRVATGLISRLPVQLRPDQVRTEAQGAAPAVHLAASPGTAEWAGTYVSECSPRAPSEAAGDEAAQERLWEWSEDVTGVEYPG